MNTEGNEEPSCKICMEGESEGNILITPCKCSIRSVHEECLKAWILSLGDDMAETKCDLCKSSYQMHIKINSSVSCSKICKHKRKYCLFLPVLLVTIGILIVGIVFLFQKYEDSEGADKAYFQAFLIGSFLAAFILLILIFHFAREICTHVEIEEWSILSKDNPTQIDRSKDEIADRTAEYRGMTASMLIMPETIRYKGKKYHMPKINPPGLTPVYRKNALVAYHPRFEDSLVQAKSIHKGWHSNIERYQRIQPLTLLISR